MDKGWSWVTMLAAFGTHFSVGGLQYTAGFMRVILLQNADSNQKTYITWITSIYSGMIYLVGPIASFIVYKYGCRTTVIVGASLEVIGFIICFLVRDIWIYIISYSLLADSELDLLPAIFSCAITAHYKSNGGYVFDFLGIGSGLTYAAILVLVSFNFDRYLSFASGVAVSGQGAGLIIMPIVCNFIYEKYGLQPTFLIIGGVSLQKWVLGALMRPSSFELEQLSKSRNSKKINHEMNVKIKNKFVDEKPSKIENGKNNSEKVFSPGVISDVERLKQESAHKGKNNHVSVIYTSDFEVKAETSARSADVISGQDNMSYNFDGVENTTNERHDVKNTSSFGSKKENNTLCITVDEIKKPDDSNISEEDFPPKNKMADMFVEFSHDDETKNSSIKMSASPNEVENKTRTKNSYGNKENPYLRVLKIRKFIFFLLGILLYSVPEEIVYMMYPNYVSTKGSSQSEMSNLLSIIGISSTSARLLMGVTANSKIVDIYILFTMPFVILGVATLLLPYYVNAFIGQVFYAIIFGLYNCGVYSLVNELVSKITGINDVTAAFGFILLLKGIAGIFASPLADAIKLYAENPDAIFIFAVVSQATIISISTLLHHKIIRKIRKDKVLKLKSS